VALANEPRNGTIDICNFKKPGDLQLLTSIIATTNPITMADGALLGLGLAGASTVIYHCSRLTSAELRNNTERRLPRSLF